MIQLSGGGNWLEACIVPSQHPLKAKARLGLHIHEVVLSPLRALNRERHVFRSSVNSLVANYHRQYAIDICVITDEAQKPQQ